MSSKRVSRTLRSTAAAAPPSSASSASTDSPHAVQISEMLKTLGLSESSNTGTGTGTGSFTSARRHPAAGDTGEGVSTPIAVGRQHPSSSRSVSSTSRMRERERTNASTASAASSSSQLAGRDDDGFTAPLTAIRRPNAVPPPAQQQQQQRTPSKSLLLTRDGLPLQQQARGSPRTVSGASARGGAGSQQQQQQRKSSAPPASSAGGGDRRHSSRPPPSSSISEEEHTALLSLLHAKDSELNSLRSSFSTLQSSLSESETRLSKTEKERLAYKEQIGNLNRQLMERSEGKEREKQFEMQEKLLMGFQRENEKATAEVEGLKRREKLLTEHLRKIYGPTFSIEAELLSGTSSPTDLANRSFVASPSTLSTFNRRTSTSGFGSLLTSSSSSGSLHTIEAVQTPAPSSSTTQPQKVAGGKKPVKAEEEASFDAIALMNQLEQVQDLVGRFERRLLIRESELLQKEEEAGVESRRLEKAALVVPLEQAGGKSVIAGHA